METAGIVFWVTEVIDFMTSPAEGGDHFWLVGIPPAGGNIDFCHGINYSLCEVTEFLRLSKML